MILSIDTTHEFGSIALTSGDEVIDEVLLHSPDGFGHILYQHLERLLDRHGCRADAMECFAAACGPGSFTGVRIGIACVKGLAEATGKPVVGVSNLEAIAAFGTLALRAVVMDARRGEIYGAVYDAAGNLVQPELVTKLSAWLETLPAGEIEFLSTDLSPFRDALPPAKMTAAPRALAGAVGRIAYRRLRAGQAMDPVALDANYVRRSDAELLL